MPPSGTNCGTYLFLLRFVEVYDIARILRLNLEPETLSICCQMLEEGANPEALAALIIELQRETGAI